MASELPPEELEAMVSKAVRAGVKDVFEELFLSLGIDVSNPQSILEFQADMRHVRNWRRSTEAVKTHSMLALFGILVASLCGAVWLAVKPH